MTTSTIAMERMVMDIPRRIGMELRLRNLPPLPLSYEQLIDIIRKEEKFFVITNKV
jgi:hypothetical protein